MKEGGREGEKLAEKGEQAQHVQQPQIYILIMEPASNLFTVYL